MKHFGPLFSYGHLPDYLHPFTRPFCELAVNLLRVLKDGPELSTSLRKLLEAKDAAVRQGVLDQ